MKFRTQALTELESPEQLDEAARLATVSGWLATTALLVVIVAVAVWAIVGTVPRTVDAIGVLTHSDGVSELDAQLAGQVTQVWGIPNQRVAKGDPLYSVLDAAGAVHVVDSPWDAYVVNWLVSDGQLLQSGTRVADLERLDKPGDFLEAMVYVPASDAPLLHAGEIVALNSPSAPSSVFGTMSGTVTTVGAFTETEQSLHAFLGPDRDVRPFLASGNVVAVTVRMDTDASSPSGLAWSKAGPPFRLTSQSQVDAEFTVSQDHPVNWLIGG